MKIVQSEVAKLENKGHELTESLRTQKPSWVKGAISDKDTLFLSGLVAKIKPRRSVEIGVASGWSSTVLLKTLQQILKPKTQFEVIGIDLSADLYTDKSRRTGDAVAEIAPETLNNYQLLTGHLSFDAMPSVGKVDFAFIDAHHMHPWPVIDLIAVLPFLEEGSWIALHDLNLCTVPRHAFRNRGPFYLYYMWQGARLHSSANPTMIGAIQLDRALDQLLKELFQILATPWEIHLQATEIESVSALIATHFGEKAASDFETAAAYGSLGAD